MNLLSRLVAPIILSVPLSSGCATYSSSSTREIFDRRGELVDLGTEISCRIVPTITSDIVQTDKGETELGIKVEGEQITQEIKRSRKIITIRQREIIRYEKQEPDPLLQFIGGVLIIPAIAWAIEPKEKVEYGPVETKIEESPVLETRVPDIRKKMLSFDGVEVRLSSEEDLFFNGKNPATLTTDRNGRTAANLFSNTFAMNLEELVQKNPIFSEFQPATMQIRDNLLKRGIVDVPLFYQIKINNGFYNEIPLLGVVKTGNFNCKGISHEFLSREISSFVKTNINPSLKTVMMTVRDIDTHTPLRKTTYIVNTTSPSAGDMLKPYFSGKTLAIAQNYLGHYESGERTSQSEDGAITLVFAPGSDVNLEVRNPQYNFYKGEFKVTERTERKTIEMSEVGQKVRVRIVDE